MAQFYSDPSRTDSPTALPDVEVFYIGETLPAEPPGSELRRPIGWYWWSCFPGCLPDSDPFGPFETEAEAIADAQDF